MLRRRAPARSPSSTTFPIELMAKVLQQLARRGLLTSHQGTRGGYRLSKPTTSISVADIIQAIDGPLTVTACSTEDEQCGQYCEMQRARSVVADQGSDRRRARHLLSRRDRLRYANRRDRDAVVADAQYERAPLHDDRSSPLPRLSRDDSGRSASTGRHAAVLHGAIRQSGQPPACVGLGGRQGRWISPALRSRR